MLVLSRQRNESIIIGDNIKVTVIEIRGDKVRIGVEAPKEIPVHREEVYNEIQRLNVAEAATDYRGLAGAGAEFDLYQAPEDDQPLQQKMEDERGNHRD